MFEIQKRFKHRHEVSFNTYCRDELIQHNDDDTERKFTILEFSNDYGALDGFSNKCHE